MQLTTANQGIILLPHNWIEGFKEGFSWLTDLTVAHDRTEQRSRLRATPRRRWDLHYTATGDQRRRLETLLAARAVRHYLLPTPTDSRPITAPIAAEDTTLALASPLLYDYAVGRQLAVWITPDDYELATVAEIGADTITVAEPFTRAWPAETLCAPLRQALILDTRRLTRFTPDTADCMVTAEIIDGGLTPAEISPEIWQGHYICPFAPTWQPDAEETIGHKWVRLDNATGPLEYDIPAAEPVYSRDAAFLLAPRSTVADFLAWLHLLAGRLTPFWLSADALAFELAAPAAPGAESIIVTGMDYVRSLAASAARSAIEIETTAGEIIRRRITAAQTLEDGSEQLALDAPLANGLTDAEITRAAWLELVRLNSDEVELQWFSDGAAEITLTLVALP